jgi:hypothetical protein
MEKLLDASAVLEVNHVIKPQNFVGYEFQTKDEVYVDEAGSEFRLFRLEVFHNGDVSILVANWEEYCIHEDVTYLFDVDSIQALCEGIKDLSDHTEFYIEYCEEEFGDEL